MLSKRYEPTESILELGYMCPRDLWPTRSDIHQVIET